MKRRTLLSTTTHVPIVRLSIAMCVAMVLGCDDSSDSVACGTGTVLDEATQTCVPDLSGTPDFNRFLEDEVALGDLTLSNVEVPDKLVEGSTIDLSFTIRNSSTKDKPATMLRLSAAPGDEDYFKEKYLDKIRTAGTVCTNSCPYDWLLDDGICQDGGKDSDTSAGTCPLGTDCNDCGPRKDMVLAKDDGRCDDERFLPEPNTEVCHIQPVTLAVLYIEDLKAGEETEINYTITIPYIEEKATDAMFRWGERYTLVFSLNDQRLKKDDNGFIIPDPAQPRPLGAVDLELAEAVVAPTSVRSKSAEPGIYFVEEGSNIAEHSFELPRNDYDVIPVFTVMAKLLGVYARDADFLATLKMPGHNSNGDYDSKRSFDLRFGFPGNNSFYSERYRLPRYCEWSNTCDSISSRHPFSRAIPHGGTLDTVFQLLLSPDDRKLLAQTLKYRSANPDLNNNDELPGKVELTVKPSDGDTKKITFDVVFMPPEANPDAYWKDPNAPPTTTPSDQIVYAKDYPSKTYPEVDNLTPEFFNKLDTSIIGAEVKVSNKSSKERLADAVVSQALTLDNYAAINLLGLRLYLMKLDGNVDWGTRRALKDNIAWLNASVIDTDSFSLSGVVKNLAESFIESGNFDSAFSNDSIMRSLLSISFDFDEQCEIDEDNEDLETCAIIEPDDGEEDEPEFGLTLNTPETPSFPTGYSWTLSKTMEEELCYAKVICLKASFETSLTVGVNGELNFYRDTSQDPLIDTGIEAKIGPYAKADGAASGGIDVRLAAAGLEGNLNFFTADFKPTLKIGLLQQLGEGDDGESCWMKNHGYVHFLGPVNFKALGGNVGVYVDLGPPPVDLGLFTLNLRIRVVDEEIVSWDPPIDKTWYLWNELYQFRGGDGLCDDANTDTFWKSPSRCKTLTGAAGYCPNSFNDISLLYSSAVTALKEAGPTTFAGRFHTGLSQCGTVTVNGRTEPYRKVGGSISGDRLIFYPMPNYFDASKCEVPYDFKSIIGKYEGIYTGELVCQGVELLSGTFSNTSFRFCNTNNDDSLRNIDFWLVTDEGISDTGVSLTIELDDQPEPYFKTSKEWFALQSSTEPTNWNKLDYDGPEVFGKAVDGEHTSYAIWGTAAPQNNVYNYFRRPFIAAGDKMVIRTLCDNECWYYIDGKELGTAQWDQWKEISMPTIPGALHLLGIKCLDYGGGRGLSAVVRMDDPIYSDNTWLSYKGDIIDDSAGRKWYEAGYEYVTAFVNAKEYGNLTDSLWARTATAPFDTADAEKAQWIWVGSAGDLSSIPAETVYLRHEFVAQNPQYTINVRCDNRCKVWMNGDLVVDHGDWGNPGVASVSAKVGQTNIIAIEAKNDSPGAASVNFMMQ